MKTQNKKNSLSLLFLSLGLGACALTASKPTKVPPKHEVATMAYGVGSKALQEKNPKKAIKYLAACLKYDRGNSNCQYDLGWAFFMDYEFNKAKVIWEGLKKTHPKKKGLGAALAKVNTHIDYQNKALALRKTAPEKLESGRFPASAEETFTISAVGDVMLGSDSPVMMLPPGDKSPLEFVEKTLDDTDVTFANYEGSFCDSKELSKKCDGKGKDCFVFKTPTKYAPHLKEAGFDLISLANNHAMDFGEECRKQTEKTLEAQGISWSGRAGSVAKFDKKDIKISMIAFHSADHSNSIYKIKTAKKMIETEKKAGRVVIISVHAGAEGIEGLKTNNELVDFSHKMIDAGADMIVGSGPHVVRGMEIYKDRLIAYSLGNFSTFKGMSLWGLNSAGLILQAELSTSGKFVKGKVIPTRQLQYGYPVIDKRDTAIDMIRFLSHEDFKEHGVSLTKDGHIFPSTSRSIASEKK